MVIAIFCIKTMGIIHCMRKNNNSFIKEINCLPKLKRHKGYFFSRKNKATHFRIALLKKLNLLL